MSFIDLKYENMTWYDTYEEIKTKYPDTVFEEYWLTKDDADKLKRYEPIKKGWVTIENNPDTSGFIISSDKCVINGFKAEKNDGDERSILLHIGILSPFNDDPVIIKQKGI